jgi:DNA-binding CsgD family transcriptional regulator/PAS domain-containing protein
MVGAPLQMDRIFSETVSAIYDCAVDPALWPPTLDRIREAMGVAYVGLNVVEFREPGPPRPTLVQGTEWEGVWLDRLMESLESLPGYRDMRRAPIDQPIVFRRLIPKEAFEASHFYKSWVEPQGLHDACNTPFIQRSDLTAMLTAWTAKAGRRTLSPRNLDLLVGLAPHLRRAILISDLLDRERRLQRVHAALLDRLSVAVLLVGPDGCIVYANGGAERILSEGRHLRSAAGRARPASSSHALAFAEALRRATTAQDEVMESWGCGTVLPATDGSAAVAYVLPFGQSDTRQALGEGMAAVVLVEPDKVPPPPVELVAALLGLTSAEARVALAVAEGWGTDEITDRLHISLNTLKTHLGTIFNKTGLRDRTALGSTINRLRLPLGASSGSASAL